MRPDRSVNRRASSWVLLRQALRAIGIAVVALSVLALGVVALGIHLNERAKEQAVSLCRQIPHGAPEAEAVAMAGKAGSRHLQGPGKHEFRFQGWVFNASSCEVSIEAGTVSALAVVDVED